MMMAFGEDFVEREPDVAAFGLVELAERIERHHAAVLDAQPSGPVFALHVADGRAKLATPTAFRRRREV
jgi:Leu/Phe-tRNA-protein transferase